MRTSSYSLKYILAFASFYLFNLLQRSIGVTVSKSPLLMRPNNIFMVPGWMTRPRIVLATDGIEYLFDRVIFRVLYI
jgi:hypothetical protein